VPVSEKCVLSYARTHALFACKSHAPTEPQPHRDGNVFWLDAAVEPALNILQAEGKYVGRILDDSKVENAYLIYVKEFTPTNAYVLPSYISRLNRYTEKECRRICREIAEIIKLSHDSGMAHRNLLLTNVLVDRTVRRRDCRMSRSVFGTRSTCSRITPRSISCNRVTYW
jgi:serine/threonine protein kinase